MDTRLDNYIQEVRERYNEEQRAHLDVEMRRFDLAGQLLSLRLDADVTQQQLAERSGISQADISRYERGLGTPPARRSTRSPWRLRLRAGRSGGF